MCTLILKILEAAAEPHVNVIHAAHRIGELNAD